MEDLYTSIESEIDSDRRVSVNDWDDVGVFLTVNFRGGSASLPLSKADAAKLVDAIQRVLARS